MSSNIKPKILVVGELNVDIILNQIEGYPQIGKEVLAENLTMTLGSSSAIFASNLSSLGSDVLFFGKVGKDIFGNFVKDALKSKNVDISNLIETENNFTGATIVLNYDMDRAMVTAQGAMKDLSENEISDELLASVSHLHVSSIFLQPKLKKGIYNLFQRAKELGLSTSFDSQWDPEEKWDLDLERLLPNVDVFIPNNKEFLFLTKSESLSEGLEKVNQFAKIVVIKDGENGAIFWQNHQIESQEAYLNTDVVDCIGAGDSFDAGFIHKYLQKNTLNDCVDFANICGAMNTTSAGGTSVFESMDNFKLIAKNKFQYEFKTEITR